MKFKYPNKKLIRIEKMTLEKPIKHFCLSNELPDVWPIGIVPIRDSQTNWVSSHSHFSNKISEIKLATD